MIPELPGTGMAGITLTVALGYLVLAIVSHVRRAPLALPAYAIALLATGLWLGLVALFGPSGLLALLGEAVRNLCWLWFMAAIAGRRESERRISPLGWIYVGLFGVQALIAAVLIVSAAATKPSAIVFGPALSSLQMLFAAGALVLVHNLIDASQAEERRALTMPLAAMAIMWGYDLNLAAIGYLSGEPATLLLHLRPLMAWLLLAILGIAALRPGTKAVRLSRPAAFRSIGLAAVAVWLALLSIVAAVVRGGGGDFSTRAQIVVLATGVLISGCLFASPRLRAKIRVWTAKHFYEHRYDYRTEWLRFTKTLNRPEAGGLSLDTRAIKAIADIVESDGGVMICPGDDGSWTVSGVWPTDSIAVPDNADWSAFAAWLETSGRIIQFDEVRDGRCPAQEIAATPPWMLADVRLWIAMPLIHLERVEGLVLLGRPVLDRPLDWEDFDLLRVAGQQAASHLAEARGSGALAEAVRFDEFHRRFAFVMHDVKNLASQMALLARNAERHGDNPEFRTDMIDTLRLSADRLSQLMQRLSQQERVREARLGAVDLAAIAKRLVKAKRGIHPVMFESSLDAPANGDPEMIEQLLAHLVQNAIDATPGTVPVVLRLQNDGAQICAIVEDRGCGMSAAYMRNELFRPFSSTKDSGFGIGAYQARQLAAAMGGTLSVDSREGEGTKFTLRLPRFATDPAQVDASRAA